jgi:signal transduction histidine kinase
MEAVKDSTFINALLPFVVIIFIIGVGVVLLYQHFQKNLFSQKLKQETLKAAHQNELLRSSIHAQEQERKRIAQDLHDELGAVLSIMRMNMVMLEQQNKNSEGNLLAGLQNVRSLSESAINSVRAISHRLMPPQLEAFGLISTLESAIDQINTAGKIHIGLTAPDALPEIPWAISLGLYRIIMELTNNTIKHADANQIELEISIHSTLITCRFADNGKGLPAEHIGKGLGHMSIEGRVNSLNGKFEFGTGSEGGFYATIHIPFEPTHNHVNTQNLPT